MYEFYNKTKPADVGPASAPVESLKQQVFTKVVQHLRKQGERSTREGMPALCAYRGAEGRMCAVGCLITDACYDESLEGLPAEAYRVQVAVAQSLGAKLGEGLLALLQDMQRVHDDRTSEWGWEQEFRTVANRFGLQVPPKQ